MESIREDRNGGVTLGVINLLVLHKAWGSGRMLKEKVYVGERKEPRLKASINMGEVRDSQRIKQETQRWS